MPRNMSFMLTTEQVRNRTKDVTRRRGWKSLKPGELFHAVEQAQGLKKGQKLKRLAVLRCVSNTPSRLDEITPDDVRREGFPELTVEQFVAMFYRNLGGDERQVVNRIEFAYVDEQKSE